MSDVKGAPNELVVVLLLAQVSSPSRLSQTATHLLFLVDVCDLVDHAGLG